jgi:hypothetical protein
MAEEKKVKKNSIDKNRLLEGILRTLRELDVVNFPNIDVPYIRRFIDERLPKEKDPVYEDLVVTYANDINNYLTNAPVDLDLHEYLQSNIGVREENDSDTTAAYVTNEDRPVSLKPDGAIDIVSMFGSSNPYDLTRMLNPNNLLRKTYLNLDTRYASVVSNDRTKFTWNYLENANVQFGSTNTTDKVRDIVSMKLMSFTMPLFEVLAKPFVTVLVDEFSGQSLISPQGRKFHFIGTFGSIGSVSIIDTKAGITFDESTNEGVFHFRRPITHLDKISLSMANPYHLISIHQDTYPGCALDVTTSPPGGPWFIKTLTRTDASPFQFIDIMYISGYMTSTPDLDLDLINFVNRAEGFRRIMGTFNPLVLHMEPFLIGGGIMAPSDVARMLPPHGVQVGTITLYIGDYRILFNLELTYIDPSINTKPVEYEKLN